MIIMDELRRENKRFKRENQEFRDSPKQVMERLITAEQTIKHLREQLGQASLKCQRSQINALIKYRKPR